MREEKKEFSRMKPETREMLRLKYYSKLFEEVYQSNETWKEKKRKFLERQERLFQASREGKNKTSKGKYW